MRCATALDLTTHHRVNRGMGGAREEWINQAHNLLLVCTVCNGWFEDNRGCRTRPGGRSAGRSCPARCR